MDQLHMLGTDQQGRYTPYTGLLVRCVPCQNSYISVSPPKSKKERNDVLGVGWGAERPGTSIVVVADGPEPLRSDIQVRLPLTPIRKIYVKTVTRVL